MRHRLGEWQEFAVEKLEGDDVEARLASLVAKVKTPASVDIFLPRDQILFTDVKVSGDTPTTEEIYSAMDGRTPYDLADLEIDWVATTPGTARVAAIAVQTLNEAEAFVTRGGLIVRAFSALPAPEDFPRPPVFVEREAPPETQAPSDEPEPDTNTLDETLAFATARTVSAPLVLQHAQTPPARTTSESEPVVKVDDPTPVMQLPKTAVPPLNPGAPLPRPTSQPRIVTNVGAAAASARADSLTAPASVAVRRRERAVPAPALVGIAALLSIVIAVIIWSILPSTPQSSLVAPETVEVAPAPEVVIAEATPPAPADIQPEASPLPDDITLISEAPAELTAPETSPVLAWVSSAAPAITPANIPLETAQSFMADPRPTVEWLEPRPETLDAIEDYAPVAFVPETLAFIESPDLTELAAFEPFAGAVAPVIAFPVPDVTALVGPTLETEGPDAFVAPAAVAETIPEEAIAPEDQPTELAALDLEINAPLPPVAESEPALPDADAPDQTLAEDTGQLTTADAPDLTPTALAAALPETAPRARPGAFSLEIERQQFGGRTRDELAEIRPGTRPESAQIEALVARAGNPPSDLAVGSSITPRNKPRDFDSIVAAGLLQLRQEREARALAALTPDTSDAIEAALAEEADEAAAEEATRPQNSPRLAIPSSASVARQATIEEAMRLNQINLVGVFGRPSDRRALVRLPSGRYVKVQVGDRVDGGTVAGISETALQYQKGGRTVQLTMPQG